MFSELVLYYAWSLSIPLNGFMDRVLDIYREIYSYILSIPLNGFGG